MRLQRINDFCFICGDKLTGRLDKVFCSSTCRSRYHRRRHTSRRESTRMIDSILHRNHVLLSEHWEKVRKKKFFIDTARLEKLGFNPRYFTTKDINSQGKAYYYIYDYAWMQFSEKQTMIVKLGRPK